uniref:t-SNARE coiled-coil homology domain-containing protein n=1 Tax=Tetradesmus obliquus TaxID=3088 RepID=A0A383WGN5_TETOB|eukprot:jgi/Sobl393_1/16964/SZX76382.1
MSWGKTDQEIRLDALFGAFELDFGKLEKARDPAKVQGLLKEVTKKLKDAKALIHEFEREARTDGMPAREMADRKRRAANELNRFIALKKQYSSTEDGRNELLAGAGPVTAGQAETSVGYDGMTMQELMKEGRKGVQEIDGTLNRAEKVVEDTLQIGQQTAATLHDQTQQLNKIVDDLNEIEFTMKKATKIIADIGKGIMTDRCIMFLLFLVVCGVIALVVVKVVKPNQKAIQSAAESVGLPTWNATPIQQTVTNAVSNVAGKTADTLGSVGGRRLRMHAAGADTGQRWRREGW